MEGFCFSRKVLFGMESGGLYGWSEFFKKIRICIFFASNFSGCFSCARSAHFGVFVLMKSSSLLLPLLCLGLAGSAPATLVFIPTDITTGTGSTAAQSSTPYGGCTADKAIDGDYATGSHTEPGDVGPWWQVDFGTTHSFNQIKLYNRSGLEARLADITVEVLDGETVLYTSPVLNENHNDGDPSVITVNLGVNGYTADKIKVSRDPNSTPDSGILTLMEVKIGTLTDVIFPAGTNLTHSGLANMVVSQSSTC